MRGSDRPPVLDASALLAVLLEEPGAEQVLPLLSGGLVSAVNAAEVLSRLARSGVPVGRAMDELSELDLRIVEAGPRHAAPVAALHAASRSHGLSLADCFCFALAQEIGGSVVTADRAWRKVEAGVPVVVVR